MIVKTKKGDLPVKYGMNALAKFGDLTGRDMNQVIERLNSFDNLSFSEMLAFIYAGFYGGATWEEVDCAIKSPQEVGNMLDDDSDLLKKMLEIYNDVPEGKTDSKKK